MSQVFYTSDLHFGHARMLDFRAYDSIEEHDEAIVWNWRDAVRKEDIVYVMGDLTLKSPAQALKTIGSLPGRKRLIVGNHDGIHPMFKTDTKWESEHRAVFESIWPFGRRRIAGREVLLSHFPYTADHGFEARYPQWRLPDLGAILLHGHTHSTEKVTSDHEIHIGLDAWEMTPVSEIEVAALIEESFPMLATVLEAHS